MVLALTSLPSQEEAEKLIRILLDARLIACGSCIPSALSFYIWEGKICNDTETLVLLKAPKETQGALEAKLLEVHPYEVPEFLVFDAAHVSESYRKWAMSSCIANKDIS